MAKNTQIKNFEHNLQELETLVESMESGELSLDEALKHFEKGIKTVRSCQEALSAAEQRVQILLEDDDGQAQISDFSVDKGSDLPF